MTTPEFDIVFVGISSYTGQLVTEEISRRYAAPNETFRFAFAGSSMKRLVEAENMMKKIDTKQTDVVKIELDQTNPEAVRDLCKRTRVICALKGPFDLYGEAIVKACAESGVHYCDITGELDWVAEMRDKYNDIAKTTKAAILPCCGYDFVPIDVLFHLLKDSVKGADLPSHPAVHVHINPPIPASWSGGTMRTVFNQKTVNRDPWTPLCKAVTDKLAISSSEATLLPKFQESNGRWGGPNIMGPGMAKYCRWINELAGFPLKSNMIVDVTSSRKSYFKALLCTFNILFVILLAISAKIIPRIATWFPQKQGAGPSRDLQQLEAIRLDARVKIGEKMHTVKFEYNNGGAYLMTAVSVLETAICLAKMEKQHDVGFSSPTLVMKDQVIKRYKAQDFTFSS